MASQHEFALQYPQERFGSPFGFVKRYCEVLVRHCGLIIGFLLVSNLPVLLITELVKPSLLIEQTILGATYQSIALVFLWVVWACIVIFQVNALTVLLAGRLMPQPMTVSQALRWSLARVPAVFLWSLVAAVIVFAGFLLLIIPGVYLLGRLLPVVEVALFEPGVNPLRRSWEITRGRVLDVLLTWLGVAAVWLPFGLLSSYLLSYLPSFREVDQVQAAANVLLGQGLSVPFWLLLYGWFREETVSPEAARSILPQGSVS
jgi:hypothetical protein